MHFKNNQREPDLKLFTQPVDGKHCEHHNIRKNSKAERSSHNNQTGSFLDDNTNHSSKLDLQISSKNSLKKESKNYSTNLIISPFQVNTDIKDSKGKEDKEDDYSQIKMRLIDNNNFYQPFEFDNQSALSYSFDGLDIKEIQKVVDKSEDSLVIESEENFEEKEICEISAIGLISDEDKVRARLNSNEKSEKEDIEVDANKTNQKIIQTNKQNLLIFQLTEGAKSSLQKFCIYLGGNWKENIFNTKAQVSNLIENSIWNFNAEIDWENQYCSGSNGNFYWEACNYNDYLAGNPNVVDNYLTNNYEIFLAYFSPYLNNENPFVNLYDNSKSKRLNRNDFLYNNFESKNLLPQIEPSKKNRFSARKKIKIQADNQSHQVPIPQTKPYYQQQKQPKSKKIKENNKYNNIYDNRNLKCFNFMNNN